MSRARHAAIRRHVAPRLLTQMRIFSAVIAIVLAVVWYRLYSGGIGFFMALLAFALGTGIGFAAGRMALVFWHPDEEHVASRIDALGAAFLVVYVVIEIGKWWFFGHWLSGGELSAFNLAFLAGLLSGRLLSLRSSVWSVLRAKNKISYPRG